MYKKKSKIEKVIQFIVDDNNLYFRDSMYCFFVNNNKIIDNADDFKLIGDSYIYFFNRDYTKSFIYNLKTLELKEISKNIRITNNCIGENEYLSYKFSDDYMFFQIVIYNISEFRISTDLNIYNTYLSFYYDEKIISKYNDSINLFTLSGHKLWEYPLSLLGGTEYEPDKIDTINTILGVIHGNIWFYTNFSRLVALDLETGEKKYSLNCFGVYLDNKTKNIFAIASNIITIIDTQRLIISERYNFKEADPMGIGSYRIVYSPLLQGDYFTFLCKKEEDSGGIRRAGIFNYKSRKLVWEYEVISKEEYDTTGNRLGTSNPLYMRGNKLYIKDIKDNLHIFERDDI